FAEVREYRFRIRSGQPHCCQHGPAVSRLPVGPTVHTLFYWRIHDSIASIPGVSSVALCQYSPVGYGWGAGVWVDGHPAPGPNDDNSAAWDRVSAGYLDVIGTPVVRGRGITEEDAPSSRKVAVINEAFAREFF